MLGARVWFGSSSDIAPHSQRCVSNQTMYPSGNRCFAQHRVLTLILSTTRLLHSVRGTVLLQLVNVTWCHKLCMASCADDAVLKTTYFSHVDLFFISLYFCIPSAFLLRRLQPRDGKACLGRSMLMHHVRVYTCTVDSQFHSRCVQILAPGFM